jgi:hypothetical protein
MMKPIPLQCKPGDMSRLAVLFLPSGAAGAGYEQPDKSRAICNLAGPRA